MKPRHKERKLTCSSPHRHLAEHPRLYLSSPHIQSFVLGSPKIPLLVIFPKQNCAIPSPYYYMHLHTHFSPDYFQLKGLDIWLLVAWYNLTGETVPETLGPYTGAHPWRGTRNISGSHSSAKWETSCAKIANTEAPMGFKGHKWDSRRGKILPISLFY